MGDKIIKVSDSEIGEGKPIFVIAEIGINHGGDFSIAEELIQSAAAAGANAVKLQTYITEKRVPTDSPIFGLLKQCELTYDEQERLFKIGRDLDVLVFSTPFDTEAVDFLESIENPVYKVASFDTINKALLRKIGRTGKPVIMSTGMTNIEELGAAWKELGGLDDGTGCDLALLHCVSSYPTPPEAANLSVIKLLHRLHNGPVGYSDHTIGTEIPIMAVAAGAQLVEKHFTLDTAAEGPDHALSADPETLKSMIQGIRRMESILGPAQMGIRNIEYAIVPFRRKTE